MTYEAIRYELTDGIATITLNRPTVHNAMNERMREELTACFGEIAQGGDARVVVVTGAGDRAFSAGADIREFVAPQVPVKFRDARRRVDFRAAMDRCGQPIIAAIRGFALGGGLELALACDLRFASKTAKLGLPEVSLGIIPGYGGTQRLPRLCGTGTALQLILTGDPITAEEALRVGLVNGVFAPPELMAGVKAVANKMVSRGPRALALAKQAVRRGIHLPLADGLRLEADLFGAISSTAEMKEGMQAFLDKRKASWIRGG